MSEPKHVVAPLNRIDDEKIGELEKLEAAATPTPWWFDPEQATEASYHYARLLTAGPTDYWSGDAEDEMRLDGALSTADAALIAALRNAAPLLLAEVKAQRQENERLTRERDAYKRAKSENDDRFMLERDAARAQVARVEECAADFAALPSSNWTGRMVADTFRAATADQ